MAPIESEDLSAHKTPGLEIETDTIRIKKNGKQGQSGRLFEDGEIETEEEEDAKISFPRLSYSGNGHTTYKMDKKLAMSMTIETNIDDESLNLNQSAAHVSCGKLDGCKQRDVDTSVQANSVGLNRYARLKKEEKAEFEKSGFRSVRYAIFATEVVSLRGHIFKFDKPLPVYPWPAPSSRYDEATAQGESWSTRVQINQEVNNKGQNLSAFNATVSIQKISESSSLTTLRLTLDIPEDREGALYKIFPIPKTAIYSIDTESRDIVQIDQTSWTHGDKSKRREETLLLFKLCSKEIDGRREDFSCS